jgi:hypothetical protein
VRGSNKSIERNVGRGFNKEIIKKVGSVSYGFQVGSNWNECGEMHSK